MSKFIIHYVVLIAMLVGPVSSQSAEYVPESNKLRIYLLGEIHDNPQNHQLRLAFINKQIANGEYPIILMEQFDRDKQSTLDAALINCHDVDCVIKKAATPGWNWDFYKPFIQLGLDKKGALVAANLSNSDVKKVITEGFASVYDAQLIQRYKLDQLSLELVKAQSIAIAEGHCGLLPEQMIAPMVHGQIARDVWMANAIQKQIRGLVILIAGNGHVRKDTGVHQWLPLNMRAQVHVQGYVENLQGSENDWFDNTYLMRPILREDPCLAFTKHMQKLN